MDPTGHWFIAILLLVGVGYKIGFKRGFVLLIASTVSDYFMPLEQFGISQPHAFMHTIVGLLLTGAIIGVGTALLFKDYTMIVISYVGTTLHAYADLIEAFFPEKLFTIPIYGQVGVAFIATLIPVMFVLGIVAIKTVLEAK